jgi:hypothetical protein
MVTRKQEGTEAGEEVFGIENSQNRVERGS